MGLRHKTETSGHTRETFEFSRHGVGGSTGGSRRATSLKRRSIYAGLLAPQPLTVIEMQAKMHVGIGAKNTRNFKETRRSSDVR